MCKLHKSINRLVQPPYSWSKCFDHEIKNLDFDQKQGLALCVLVYIYLVYDLIRKEDYN